MRSNVDPSERERALREADAQLDAMRHARKRGRQPGEESPFTEVLPGIVVPIARMKLHLVLLLALMAVMFVTSWCATP